MYVLVGTMQLILISMGAYFKVRDRSQPEKGEETACEGDFEVYQAYVRSRGPSTISFAPSASTPNERSSLLPHRRNSEHH